MQHTKRILSAFLLLLSIGVSGFAQEVGQKQEGESAEGESAPQKITDLFDVKPGPLKGNMESLAEIEVPVGYVFADKTVTGQLMEMMQNPLSNTEIGLVAPESMDWFVVFEFDETGYIKDDEKDSLDADAMLASIQEATAASNSERLSRGWPTMIITGWVQEPFYDETTNNLAWAISATSEGSEIVNYNTRILGRSGVTRVTLVADPALLPTIMPEYKALMDTFDYTSGNRYAEYREGDKIAEYGLSALVVGGAAAVAAKSGLFKYLGKGAVLIFAAIAAVIAKIVSFFKGKKQDDTEPGA